MTQATPNMKLNYKDGVWWMAKNNDMAKGPGAYPKIEVPYGQPGVLTFTIQTPNNVNFAETEPFAPKTGKQNPTDFKDQLTVASGNGKNTLVVKDANANKNGGKYAGGDYHYELRFSNGTKLDPIISNGGCCNNLLSTSFLIAAGVAVALLVWWTWQVISYRRISAARPIGAGNDKSAG